MPSNPIDVARLGHRYQVRVQHMGSGRTLVASRIQRADPVGRYNTEVYHELGTVDPTGSASESPEFVVTLEENVHNAELDLLLAGKSAIATTFNVADFINNSKLNVFILERDNDGNIQGEVEFDQGVLSEVQYQWRMGQPIVATYTINCRLGGRWKAADAPHYNANTWGTQDLVSAGGIKVKDARLFLGGTAAGSRMYRLQTMTLRTQFRTTIVRELGSRALVGAVVEPPDTTLDFDLDAADYQPDDIVFAFQNTPTAYYDYTAPQQLGDSAIRIYDPTAAEGSSVLRAWKLENLYPASASPIAAQVRGVATKRYSFMLPKATTAGSGGVLCFVGDIV